MMKIFRIPGWILLVLMCLSTAYADDVPIGKIAVDEDMLKQAIEKIIRENPKLVYDAYNQYKNELNEKRKKKRLEHSFSNRVEIVPEKNDPARGAENPEITIFEFSDFECPYCKRGADTMEYLLKKYPDTIRLVFKHHPLPFHENALDAAMASMAAYKQGKFWEYYHILFNNSKNLNEENFIAFANELGLDMERFLEDRQDEELAEKIAEDIALAEKLDLKGTPAYVLNGVVVKGAQPPSYFEEVIKRLLEEKKSAGAKKKKEEEQ